MGHSLFPSFRWVDFHVDICTSIHLMLPGNKQKEHVYSPLSISCQYTSANIVIIRFPWLHFIFKPSIVKSKKNRKSSKDRLFWHYDGKNATYVDNFVFGLLMSHGFEDKNTGIVIFNQNLKWNDHCVLSWWVIWTYCYTPPEIITCYKCIAFQYVVRRSLCLVV